jgi:hypothetical protein
MINGRFIGASAALVLALALLGSAAASANPITLPTLSNEVAKQQAIVAAHQVINPPAPPCPESGMLPEPFSNCGLPEAPATTLPYPTNMAYWGGNVEVTPKVYVVYFGWGEPGAFPANKPCRAEAIQEGTLKATLKCDPDGAGARMANFVSQMGGTGWARVSTQYFQESGGSKRHITNPANVLAGIWVDDKNNGNLSKTTSSNPPGATNTYSEMGAEAARAAEHFHVTDLADANFVIAQPEKFSDPNAFASGYCAFHDYTQPGLEKGIYNGIKPGIAYTNMPYVLAIDSEPATGGEPANDCGTNAVNSGPEGKLDGVPSCSGTRSRRRSPIPGPRTSSGADWKSASSAAGTTRSTPTRTATSARGWASRSSADSRASRKSSPCPARWVTSRATAAPRSRCSRCGATKRPPGAVSAPAQARTFPERTKW